MQRLPPPTLTPAILAAHKQQFERVVARLIHNLAAHDADYSSWDFLPPSFLLEWLCVKPAAGSRPASTVQPDWTLHAWLDQQREFWKTHPDHHVRLLDIDTVVSAKASSAVSYVNIAVSGRFPGVISKCVCTMTFQWRGKWEPVRFSALSGLAP